MTFPSREALVEMGLKCLGDGVRISDKASVHDTDRIVIGNRTRVDDFCVPPGCNVHAAVFCNLAGGTEGITMEDFSGLAYDVQVIGQSDDYGRDSMTNPTVPARYKCEKLKPMVIGRHCLAGTESIVMPGVVVGEGCAVGAIQIVTKSTDPWAVYFGTPARRLKARKRGLLPHAQEYLRAEAVSSNGNEV